MRQFIVLENRYSKDFNKDMLFEKTIYEESEEQAIETCNIEGYLYMGEYVEAIPWENAEDNEIFQNLIIDNL